MKGQEYLKNVTTLRLDAEKCTGCGLCEIVCPHGVFAVKDSKAAVVDRDACMECGACKSNCASAAIEVNPGVGCAAAIIIGALTGTEPRCDSSSDSQSPCCE